MDTNKNSGLDMLVLEQVDRILAMRQERDRAIARAGQAEAALARASEPCVWKARKRERGGGTMIEPTCERAAGDWGFISAMESMPTRFCPNCGHPIEVQP